METFKFTSFDKRAEEAYRVANELYEAEPDWIAFFREVLGVGGIVRRLFPKADVFADFTRTDQYAKIQQMLGQLRKGSVRRKRVEPNRVITIRLPKSVHEALQVEASLLGTSMNRMCISKLLEVLEEEFSPLEPRGDDGEAARIANQAEVE